MYLKILSLFCMSTGTTFLNYDRKRNDAGWDQSWGTEMEIERTTKLWWPEIKHVYLDEAIGRREMIAKDSRQPWYPNSEELPVIPSNFSLEYDLSWWLVLNSLWSQMCFIDFQCPIQVSRAYGSNIAPGKTWALKGKTGSYEIQKSPRWTGTW